MRRFSLAIIGVCLALAMTVFAAIASAGGGAQVAVQTPEDAAATSLAAALRIFDGTDDPECRSGAGDMACVQPGSTPEQTARGIAQFGVGGSGPEGQGAFLGVLGRDPAGVWHFWFGTQNVFYQRLDLPGDMVVCAPGGLNVRSGPSIDAPVVETLPDRARVTAEQFTLTQPGTMPTESADLVAGSGWYYLSAPVAGWSSSLYLTNAATDVDMDIPTCFIHDLFAGR